VVLSAWSFATASSGASFAADKDVGANPYGIVALGVGVLVLIILLITFRRR
jgi:hypothetical protein